MDLGADVADSTDWLGTPLACLMPVEQAFRCHVCKDFYNSPMITSCNHTFCSLCIRRCLAADGKCPLCRMADQESKLRGNWALREAIDAFGQARAIVLAVARQPPPTSRGPSPVPKRKADETGPGSSQERSSGEGPQPKRTRSSTRLCKTKAAVAVTTMAQEEIVEEETSFHAGSGADRDDVDYQPDDGLVACPICWTRMKPWQVDRHIDTSCTGSPQKPKAKTTAASTSKWQRRSESANPFAAAANAPAPPPPERVPSLSYSLLTDTALRKKLASLGLSTSGPRMLLERRHKEWTTIWNANCDSARPKRKVELQHDLDIWERTVGCNLANAGGGGGGGSGGGSGRGSGLTTRPLSVAHQQVAQIRDKDFDGTAWSAKHNTSFKDLIANARRSRAKVEEKSSGSGSGASEDDKPTSNQGMPGSETAAAVNGEIVAPVVKPGDATEGETAAVAARTPPKPLRKEASSTGAPDAEIMFIE